MFKGRLLSCVVIKVFIFAVGDRRYSLRKSNNVQSMKTAIVHSYIKVSTISGQFNL